MSLRSVFLCSTPRTGSTFLCSLLKSSGVSGRPESYFRRQDERKWAEKWGIVREGEPHVAFGDYLKAAIAAGTTDNGVFGGRIMWGTMDELVANLARLWPEHEGSDKALLERAFGPAQFVYLRREDTVAQAVSLLRALQADIWHVTGEAGTQGAVCAPEYDRESIRNHVEEIEEHNRAWEKWFDANDIEPCRVVYETVERDPETETGRILAFIGTELPVGTRLSSANRRMSDALNNAWIERFRREAGLEP